MDTEPHFTCSICQRAYPGTPWPCMACGAPLCHEHINAGLGYCPAHPLTGWRRTWARWMGPWKTPARRPRFTP